MEAAGDQMDLTRMTMFPCVVPDRGVSEQTMDAAIARLQDLVGRDRTPKKKPWWKFWVLINGSNRGRDVRCHPNPVRLKARKREDLTILAHFGLGVCTAVAIPCGMATAATGPLEESDLLGWKYFRQFQPLLAFRHDATAPAPRPACGRCYRSELLPEGQAQLYMACRQDVRLSPLNPNSFPNRSSPRTTSRRSI